MKNVLSVKKGNKIYLYDLDLKEIEKELMENRLHSGEEIQLSFFQNQEKRVNLIDFTSLLKLEKELENYEKTTTVPVLARKAKERLNQDLATLFSKTPSYFIAEFDANFELDENIEIMKSYGKRNSDFADLFEKNRNKAGIVLSIDIDELWYLEDEYKPLSLSEPAKVLQKTKEGINQITG